ncbi:hypothetical protein ACFWBN_37410 [Streptomyces sp. NPDC059989]
MANSKKLSDSKNPEGPAFRTTTTTTGAVTVFVGAAAGGHIGR